MKGGARGEGLGRCGGCLAWARAPNGHWQLGAQVLSWKRGWGVARRGWLSWERGEIKGEFNPFVAGGSSSQSSPGLTGRGRGLGQSLIWSAPLTFHLLPASLQFWQGASVTFPPVLPLSDG